MKNKRSSNIELLRIIAMTMIIMFHYVLKSGYEYGNLNLKNYSIKCFWMFGEIGVNLFCLITGYFMIKSSFKKKKIVSLIIQANFYQLLIFCVGNYFGLLHSFDSFKQVILDLFPIIFSKYWFITAYLLVYILSPYLNLFINNLSKDSFKKFIFKCIILWCIIPTVFGIFVNSTETLLYYNRFIWMIIMYFIGSYLRLYSIKFLDNKKSFYTTFILSVILLFGSIYLIDLCALKINTLKQIDNVYFWMPNNIVMLLVNLCIFYFFLNLKIKSNSIINKISSTTLGVYMLHDSILSYDMWRLLFKSGYYLNTKYYLLAIIISTIIIFIGGFILDIIRQLIEKYVINYFVYNPLTFKIYFKIKLYYKKITNLV